MAFRALRRRVSPGERSRARKLWLRRLGLALNVCVMALFLALIPLTLLFTLLFTGGRFLGEPEGLLTIAFLLAYYRWGLPLAYPGVVCGRASVLIILDPRAKPGERADFLPSVDEVRLHRRFGTRAIRVARVLERYPQASCFVLHPDADTYLRRRLNRWPLVDRLRGVHVIRLGGWSERLTVGVQALRIRLRFL